MSKKKKITDLDSENEEFLTDLYNSNDDDLNLSEGDDMDAVADEDEDIESLNKAIEALDDEELKALVEDCAKLADDGDGGEEKSSTDHGGRSDSGHGDEKDDDDNDGGDDAPADDMDLDDESRLDTRVEGTTILPIMSEGRLDTSLPRGAVDEANLPLVPVTEAVLLPGMTLPLQLRRPGSVCTVEECAKRHAFFGVIHQQEFAAKVMPERGDLAMVGCLAEVLKVIEMPDGTKSVVVSGRRPFVLQSMRADGNGRLYARVRIVDEKYPTARHQRMKAVMANIRADIVRMAGYVDSNLPNEISFAFHNVTDQNYLLNFLCSTFPMDVSKRQKLLEWHDGYERALLLAKIVHTEVQLAKLRHDLAQRTNTKISEAQRQAYLQHQMQVIQEQLGQAAQNEADRLELQAAQRSMPRAAREAFQKEVAKLRRMSDQHPDYSISLTYLQHLLKLPWGRVTDDDRDLARARRVLDADHYGLEKVKERILEHLAVMKMRAERAERWAIGGSDLDKAPILCLFGPPGVGKTSLGKSVARALGRRYVRISLGGLHDEAEVRGHRRTYIGAMPGRIISGILKAGTDNPVFVLDEIDKMGSDFHGDPAAAMLEVLDPEQNVTFHDNYLDLDYDLSKVLFIATANSLATISEPLRDRMEIIDLTGYILEEKVEIAARHLVPKQREEHALEDVPFTIPRRTLQRIIERYTREAGVRLLDKQIAKVMRRVAWRVASGLDVPRQLKVEDLQAYLGTPDYDPDRYETGDYAGVVTGLAWTSVGGTILMVEAALCKGKGERVTLTGNLGDVMKESAVLAVQYVRSHADELGIDERIFNNYTVHIHCPEGAIPKDGPSAGITMVTALASAFTQRRVRPRIAMTGEISLRGRVLPIGGVKEKLLAARRAGITDVVLCEDNRKDVDEVKPEYLTGITCHYVRDVREVLAFALLPEQVAHPIAFDVDDKEGGEKSKS